MHGRGMTQWDISNRIEGIYGTPLSTQGTSRISDKISPETEQ